MCGATSIPCRAISAIAASQNEWLEQFSLNPRSALDSARSAGEVEVIVATQNKRSIVAPAHTSAIRLAETWSEGWRFQVGGGAVRPILQGADMSMVIPLDASNVPSHITILYEPQRRVTGLKITLVSLMVNLIAALAIVRLGARGNHFRKLQGT